MVKEDRPSRETRICENCGCSLNSPSNCPARGQICLYCKKPNHFADVCTLKAQRQRLDSVNQAGSQASQKSPESTPPSAFETIVFQSITIADVSRRGSNLHRDEVFVSINLSLPQDRIRTSSLKPNFSPVHRAKYSQ